MAEDMPVPRIKRHRMVCAAWCVVESLLFGGLFFGWASLVYVFKQEGIYSFLCNTQTNQTDTQDISIKTHDSETLLPMSHTVASGNLTESVDEIYFSEAPPGTIPDTKYFLYETCAEQDARLNLWFTIAVSVLSISTSLIGWLLYRCGPMVLRFVGSVTFSCGALMLAFINNDVPWMICPGLFFLAFGAVCISAANLQVVPFLFDRGSSVAVSLLTGFYYSAATTQWLIKVAFEHGISRQHSYILLTVLNAVLVTANTLLFFRQSPHPVVEISVPETEDDGKPRDDEKFISNGTLEKNTVIIYDEKHSVNNTCLMEKLPMDATHEEGTSMLSTTHPDDAKPSLKSCVFSRTFMFHLFWFVTNDFYLITFIGISNAMLERILSRDIVKVNHFTDVFSFSLMCAAIFSVVGGFLYDCQRMVFRERKTLQRQFLPAVFPITMATLLGVLTIGLQFIKAEIVLYPMFVLFVIYKQCVFAMTFSFIVDVYPREYFGVFYGIVFTVAGIVLFMQYAIFTWIGAGPYSPGHVNLFLLCMVLLSLVNPINLLMQGLQSLGA